MWPDSLEFGLGVFDYDDYLEVPFSFPDSPLSFLTNIIMIPANTMEHKPTHIDVTFTPETKELDFVRLSNAYFVTAGI